VGRGVYEQDSELGSVLRIELPNDAQIAIVICEKSWNGEIQFGEKVGCDFLIPLTYSDAKASLDLGHDHGVPAGAAGAIVSAEVARATP